jgi:uncharacterized RDD family membrane protein YckC
MGFAPAPPQRPSAAPPLYQGGYSAPSQSQLYFAPVIAQNYAPFFTRFFAFWIDEVLAGATGAAVIGLFAGLGSAMSLLGMGTNSTGASLSGSLLWMVGLPLGILAYVLYFVKQETSLSQATVGKRMLGIRITNMSGGTIATGQSLGRLLVKNSFSGLLFSIGFLVAAFTERKQALHDLVASTLVVTRQ